MTVLLEILKYTLPSIIVFATAYFLLKQYLEQQIKLKSIDVNKETYQSKQALKLQAYERLTLFLERIIPQNLYLRLYQKDLSARELQTAMIIAIQQEFEYNITQQLYVSPSLWQIVQLAKDQTVEIISQCASQLGENAIAPVLLDKINRVSAGFEMSPIDQAKAALRKELTLII